MAFRTKTHAFLGAVPDLGAGEAADAPDWDLLAHHVARLRSGRRPPPSAA